MKKNVLCMIPARKGSVGLRNKNIIMTKIQKKDIKNSIKKIYTPNIKKKLKNMKKYYFKQNTSNKIIKILIEKNLKNLKIKKFN